MADKTEIYNRVMTELGQTNAPSMTDVKANEVVIFNQQYDPAMKKLLAVRNWLWLEENQQIADDLAIDLEYQLEPGDPRPEFRYEWALPDDCLQVKGVYAAPHYKGQSVPYRLKNQKIYTHGEHLYLSYVKKPCEKDMPEWFVDYAVYFIARRMCRPVTGDRELMQELRANEIEAMKDALSADIRQQPIDALPSDVFISGR